MCPSSSSWTILFSRLKQQSHTHIPSLSADLLSFKILRFLLTSFESFLLDWSHSNHQADTFKVVRGPYRIIFCIILASFSLLISSHHFSSQDDAPSWEREKQDRMWSSDFCISKTSLLSFASRLIFPFLIWLQKNNLKQVLFSTFNIFAIDFLT